MTKVFPDIDVKIVCPDCRKEFQPDTFHLVGTHVLSSGKCTDCVQELFMEMPTGSGLHYPVVVNGSGERKDSMPFSNWFTAALQNSSKRKLDSQVPVRKIINTTIRKEKIVILNTIDQSYGHCVFTLMNADYYQTKTDFHLLVLVQKELQWLVPDGIDEVWVVDIPFSKAHGWYTTLSTQVNARIREFESAYLAWAFPQAPEHEFKMEKYSRIKPFPLDEWNSRLDKPVVTFIWRTDRFWRRVLPRIIDNRVTRKLFPTILKRIKHRIQFSWIVRFSEVLREKIPTVDFAVAGMDTREFPLPAWVKDYRYPTHTDESAREMCARYAASHLAIGCNGSSLVLPSCHAGSIVNIVPHDGWAVSAGSFYLRPTSLADVQYRYLLLPSDVTVERTVKTVVQILRDRSLVQILAGTPWNNHDANSKYSDWANFRKEAFEKTKYFVEKEGMLTIER